MSSTIFFPFLPSQDLTGGPWLSRSKNIFYYPGECYADSCNGHNDICFLCFPPEKSRGKPDAPTTGFQLIWMFMGTGEKNPKCHPSIFSYFSLPSLAKTHQSTDGKRSLKKTPPGDTFQNQAWFFGFYEVTCAYDAFQMRLAARSERGGEEEVSGSVDLGRMTFARIVSYLSIALS